MRIAVVGLGAVGGLLAARLARAGHDVAALARGATLEQVRAHGLQLDSGGSSVSVPLTVSDDAAALGERDLVVVAVKAPALTAAAPAIAPLLGAETIVLPAMNGVPWWFLPAAVPDEPPLESVDPGGQLLAALPLARVLGCVVHLTASSPAPGRVRHGVGERLIVGEPAGGESARVREVCAALLGCVEQPAQGVSGHGFVIAVGQRVEIVLNRGLRRRLGQRPARRLLIPAAGEDHRGDHADDRCDG